MKYYFPLHLCGSNRGCEAIAKGTANQLCSDKSNLIGLCTNIELDEKLGVNNFITLVKSIQLPLIKRFIFKVLNRIIKNKWKRQEIVYALQYQGFLKLVQQGDLVISTGGDMMCYDDNQVIYTTDYLFARNIKSVLWGCSFGKENLTPRKLKTIKHFSLIYARESITFNTLKSLGLENICLFPDPAFTLKPKECALPAFFDVNVIGINLSNYVLNGYDLNSGFGKEVANLFFYILHNTSFKILLIPHVTTSSQDDRIVVNNIKKLFEKENRIDVLNIDNLNYEEIRYVISKCRFFIGARTHSVISAYSTCVPTIAIGYSVKALGIATDLGINTKYVVNSKKFKKDTLINSLKDLINEEMNIRQHLLSVIPSYAKKAYGIKQEIQKLL